MQVIVPTLNLDIVASCVYTDPEIASVGAVAYTHLAYRRSNFLSEFKKESFRFKDRDSWKYFIFPAISFFIEENRKYMLGRVNLYD